MKPDEDSIRTYELINIDQAHSLIQIRNPKQNTRKPNPETYKQH